MSGGEAAHSVPAGAVLVAFVEAVDGGDPAQIARARHAVRDAVGGAGLVDAAAAIASFNAVVKIADGTGIPIEPWKDERTQDIRGALGIDAFKRT
jgi:hypothetical protein